MMDSEEFTTESEDDNGGDHIAGGSSSAELHLDLTKIVRRVDAPMSHRSKVYRSVRIMKASKKELEFYDVFGSDLCSDAFDIAEHDMKLLTEVDINRLFVGNGDLRNLLITDQARGSYLIMLSNKKYANPETGRVGIVQVAPSITEVLTTMRIDFMVNVRFPDETMRILPLKWRGDDERGIMQFELNGLDADDLEILVVSADEDDLLFFDIHFAREGVCLPDFIVMRASMTVGKFARAVLLDKSCLERVLRRLYHPILQDVREIIPLESYRRSSDNSFNSSGFRTTSCVPSLNLPRNVNPSTIMGSAQHYQDHRDVSFESVQNVPVDKRWDNVTKSYKTTGGWYQLTPGKQLNRNFTYGAGLLTCEIFVNVDDTIHHIQRTVYSEVYHMLRDKSSRHMKRACTQIVQMSRAVTDEFRNTNETEYMTNDEGYAEIIMEMTKGKGVAAIDPNETLISCYYVLHRYRTIFDQMAYPHIVIPPMTMDELRTPMYAGQLAKDQQEVEQYISRYILDELLQMEKDNLIERKVHLRSWGVECPTEFVGNALTKMIDNDIYENIWSKYLQDKREMNRRLEVRNITEAGVLSRVTSGFKWVFPFTSCNLTKNNE